MATPPHFFEERQPPLGLEPEFAHEHQANLQRVRQILAAIERFCAASHPIPAGWLEELQRRVPAEANFNPFADDRCKP